ncbi:MAG TPA: FkbM family methyltransferase [Chloroflexia bacterium]|nr:FkbM family methyltransferase [Chloroflexia bacterium]
MNIIEHFSITLRRSSWLTRFDWLWAGVRPVYNRLIAFFGRNGLKRVINGTDRVLVLPRFRGVPETYEPEFWHQIMSLLKLDSVVVDVGAYIGLYTVAIAKHLGSSGKVIAFEPDPDSFAALKAHVQLNRVSDHVELIQVAASAENGTVAFEVGRHSMSRIAGTQTQDARMVRSVRLDTILARNRVDILKIDVEGFEEQVLRGASGILESPERAPHTIFIEVHPYAWAELGVTSESLLKLLESSGYKVFDLRGRAIANITDYGQIVAKQCADNPE